MQWDELKTVFQSSTPRVQSDTSGEAMLEKVKAEARRFDRRIHRRDMIESVIAVALFIAFGAMLPFVGWLGRAGLLVIMASCAYTVWRLYNARQDRDDIATDSIADHLRRDIRRVDMQVNLLRNVLWWYLLPPGIGLALLTFGVDGFTLSAFTYLGFVVLLYAWIHRLNQQAVRNELLPRRAALQRQLDDIVTNGTNT